MEADWSQATTLCSPLQSAPAQEGANPMIDLYSWNTSNGRKVAIMLEELDLPYDFHAVNIGLALLSQ